MCHNKMSSSADLPSRKCGSVTFDVQNFSQLSTANHKTFCINDEFSLRFGIYPKTVVFSSSGEQVTVYVLNYPCDKTFAFQYKVSILNVKGDKLFTREYSGSFKNSLDIHYGSLLSRSEIISSQNGYLSNNTLTLLCEFEIIDENIQTVGLSTIHNDLKSLSEEFGSLLFDGKFTDVTLVVGKVGKELHVHKAILAARSPVFAAMFEHDCEEKRQNKVTITDMDVEVCAEMLGYVYTGKVQSIEKYAMELLETADKYQMDSLKGLCEQYLSSNLTIETAANVLILSDMHRANELKANCIHYITENANQVKDTDGWKVLNTSAKLLGELFLYLSSKK